jgi:hypothetical protein
MNHGIIRMAIERFTISRNDDLYEAFPHLCRTRAGRIILVYRESNGHVASEFCRLILRFSDDGGLSFSERRVFVEEDRASGILNCWNGAKIQQLDDGRILLLADRYDFPPGEWGHGMGNAHVVLWFSDDDGDTWSDPQPTDVGGICPDQVTELPDGRWLLPTNVYHEETGQCLQQIAVSHDGGGSWDAPDVICDDPDYRLAEVSIIRCPDGELVAYLREESGRRLPLQKMISRDQGGSWEGPYDTLNTAAQGMPIAGLTRDGFVLTTGRYGLPCSWRVDMGATTMRRRLDRRTIVIPRVPANEDFVARITPSPQVEFTADEVVMAAGCSTAHTFAFLEPLESALEPDVRQQKGLLLPLDLDRNNLGADSGYTGWVETEPGRFLVVNYINDDAPMAQIRGYRFGLDDF